MTERDLYLRLPWTIIREEHHDDGDYAALTISELPGFVVAGRSNEELEEAFWPTLENFIQSYLDDGQKPPAPVSEEEIAMFRLGWTRRLPVVTGRQDTTALEALSAGALFGSTQRGSLTPATAS